MGALGLKERFFPTPPPPANNALGPLPMPNFEGSLATPSGLTYTLETVDGTLPEMPVTVTVFSLNPDNQATFGTFDRMKAQAARMGFASEPEKKENSTYLFQDPINPQRTLLIDELSGDFEVSYNYGSDLGIFSQGDFESREQIISRGRAFFDDLELMTPDLATGSAEVLYMKLDGQNLVKTTSLANADAVYVNFRRSDVDETPVVYPNTQKGLVSTLVIPNADQQKGILEARYYHSTVDSDSTGTYEPITTEEAFTRLKKGEAVFASLPDPLPSSIPIRSITLGFLDPFPPQPYLQPVIVFSDDKDFSAYVPAVKY